MECTSFHASEESPAPQRATSHQRMRAEEEAPPRATHGTLEGVLQQGLKDELAGLAQRLERRLLAALQDARKVR